MDYIIFLATMQIPFLYIVWRMFRSQGERMESRTREKLRQMDERQKRISHMTDVFKMTLETSRADAASQINNIQGRLRELEKYTGLRTEAPLQARDLPSNEAPAPGQGVCLSCLWSSQPGCKSLEGACPALKASSSPEIYPGAEALFLIFAQRRLSPCDAGAGLLPALFNPSKSFSAPVYSHAGGCQANSGR